MASNPPTSTRRGRILRGAILAPFAIAVSVGVAVAQAPGAQGRPRPEPARARTTYLSDCAICHGAEGKGTDRGPTLKGVGAASVDFMVRTGYMPIRKPTDDMERRKPKYPPQLLDDLVAYASGLTDGGPPIPSVDPTAGDVSKGATAYRVQCAACHSWGGTGGALEGRQAPSILPATLTQVAEAVRTGPGTMPVFGEAAFNKSRLNDLTAYTDSLKDPDDRGGFNLGDFGPMAEGGVAIIIGLGGLVLALRWLGEHG